MHIVKRNGNLQEQANLFEETTASELRPAWMPKWYVWGVRNACSDKAIKGLKDLLSRQKIVMEQVERFKEEKPSWKNKWRKKKQEELK
eukprot:12425761-Karenia_brevis.AAC.1